MGNGAHVSLHGWGGRVLCGTKYMLCAGGFLLAQV